MNPTENILTQLRTHTSTLHSELEQTPLSLALLDTEVSSHNYVAYLQKMRGIIDFYEGNVFPVLANTLPDLSEREKLAFIDKDLKYFSLDTKDIPVFQNPEAENPTIGYAFGCMYVMEGSTLGGKVILKHVSKVLGIVPDEGGTYFGAYGEQTGHYWKTFLHNLQEYSTNNNCDAEIITGAKDTFTAIKHYFEQ